MITLVDGSKAEYHPSFNFPKHIFQKMKPHDKEQLKKGREAYRNSKKLKSRVEQLEAVISNMLDITQKTSHAMRLKFMLQQRIVTQRLQ